VAVHDSKHYLIHGAQYILSSLHSIHIDGQLLNVRQNLWDFLVNSEHHDYWLWIDAICIDQTSVQERNQQVQFMHNIYRTADEVLIWLGREADDSKHAIDYLHFWYPFTLPRFGQSPPTLNGMSKARRSECRAVQRKSVLYARALEALLRRPFWSRIWIVQEILHGRRVTVTCGASRVRWEVLRSFIASHPLVEDTSFGPKKKPIRFPLKMTRTGRPRKFRSYLPIPELKFQIIGPVQAIVRYHRDGSYYQGTSMRGGQLKLFKRMTTILKEFEYSQSTDVRDKIFALLSLFKRKLPGICGL
jgi:hypothetical protein